jgi:hypothetical protein
VLALVNTVMKNFLTSCKTISFLSGGLLHGVRLFLYSSEVLRICDLRLASCVARAHTPCSIGSELSV